MLNKIVMPAMGATMEEGVIVGWKFKEGQTVQAGDVLVEFESDKSVYELESPCSGVLRKIIAQNEQTVPVQQIIAVVGDSDEPIPAEWFTEQEAGGAETAKADAGEPIVQKAASASSDAKIKISPRARKLAEKLGVDLSTVVPSGPGGRIESSDIEKAAEGAISAGSLSPLGLARKRINQAVTQSKREIPHFYIQIEVDMTGAASFREKSGSSGSKISYNALIMKAVACGLRAEPSLNVLYTDNGYVPYDQVNVGLAIETPQGVVIGIIDDVDPLELPELSEQIGELVSAGRAEQFDRIKQHGAVMTISNVGMYRVESFLPIIHPPEAGILGIGSIAERPCVVQGELAVRRTMPVTFCVDHRISDGAVAARFLEAFAGYLETLQ